MADQFWQPYWNNVDRRRQDTRYQNALSRQDMLDQRGVRADKESFVADQVQSIAALPEEQRPQAWQQGVASYERLFGETVQPQLRQYNPQVFQGLAGRFAPEQVRAADNRQWMQNALAPQQQFSDVGPYAGGMQRPDELTRKPMGQNALVRGMFQRGMISPDKYLATMSPPELERVETASGYSYLPKTIPSGYQGEVPVVNVDGVASPKSLEMQRQSIKDARDLRDKDFDNADKLRDEYVKQSGDFVKVRDAYSRVRASTDTPSAAGDLALIFNYMKMLDPGSVVRESEFANAAASGAFGERVQAAANKIVSGERLSDAMRRDFVDRSGKLYQRTIKNHEQLKREYKRLARQNNLDPTNVIVEFGGEPVEQDQPTIEAPPAAIDYLMNNPTEKMKQAFKEKYGYLPEGV